MVICYISDGLQTLSCWTEPGLGRERVWAAEKGQGARTPHHGVTQNVQEPGLPELERGLPRCYKGTRVKVKREHTLCKAGSLTCNFKMFRHLAHGPPLARVPQTLREKAQNSLTVIYIWATTCYDKAHARC